MAGSSKTSDHFQEDEFISTLSSGLNLATVAVSSGLLNQLWGAITETKIQFKDQLSGSDLRMCFKVKEAPSCNIIIFVTSPISKSCLLENRELVSSSIISDVNFGRSSRPSFSINKAALLLLDSRKDELSRLVAQIVENHQSRPYFITGDGIGGSVASLFGLWWFYCLDGGSEIPLCVTFGSPLLEYCGFQKAAAKHSTWNKLFLHVISVDDGFPSLFMHPNYPAEGNCTGKTSTYYPLGRFLFCSGSRGACFEHHSSALLLLRKMSTESWENEQSFDYGSVIASLINGLICKDKTNLNAHGTGSSLGGTTVAAQYLADFFQLQDVGRNSELDQFLKNETSVRYQKEQTLKRAAKDLGDIKVFMSSIECFIKTSQKYKIPYYDSYKNQSVESSFSVKKLKGYLQNFWAQLVEEEETNPLERRRLRVRWLFGGTNYQRMVEPLAIADYYKGKGARNYITEGRSEEKLKHYILLEEWSRESKFETSSLKRKNNFPPFLTKDPCFWAHVEEATISCETLTKGELVRSSIEDLKDFENYVLELIKDYSVSSEIFWEESSFMKWWKEYEKILDKKLMGTSYASPLCDIMRNGSYHEYMTGSLVL